MKSRIEKPLAERKLNYFDKFVVETEIPKDILSLTISEIYKERISREDMVYEMQAWGAPSECFSDNTKAHSQFIDETACHISAMWKSPQDFLEHVQESVSYAWLYKTGIWDDLCYIVQRWEEMEEADWPQI